MHSSSSGRKKLFITLAGITILLLIFMGVLQLTQRRGKVRINVYKMPSFATVSVNGQSSSDTLYVSPGKLTLTVSADGFESVEKELEVSGGSNHVIEEFISLTPQSDDALEWVNSNAAAYQSFEQKAQQSYQTESEEMASRYPIIQDLPYRGDLYNIEYSLDNDEFRIQIEADGPLERQVAIERIKSMGYEPSDYYVEFLHFDNPFTSRNEALGSE